MMTDYKLIHETIWGSDSEIYTLIYQVDEDEINKFSKEEIRQMKEAQRERAACHIESVIRGCSKVL